MSPNQLGFGRGEVYDFYAKTSTGSFPDCYGGSTLLLQTMIREWETQESSKTLYGVLPVQSVSRGAKGVMWYYNHLLSKAIIPVAPGHHSPSSLWQHVTMVSRRLTGDGAQGRGGKSASSTKRPLNCGDFLLFYAVWCSIQKGLPLQPPYNQGWHSCSKAVSSLDCLRMVTIGQLSQF